MAAAPNSLAEKTYDVFISYRHPDRASASQLKSLLIARDLKVWFDEDELPPGEPFQAGMEKGLVKSRAIAILIGTNTLAGWQEAEMQVALNFQRRDGTRVIPVLLPGVPADVRIPVFLDNNTRVNFDKQLDEKAAIDRLYWGITLRKYSAPKAAVTRTRQERPETTEADIDDAVDDITGQWDKRPLTLFLGTRFSTGGPGMPPRNCDIATKLLQKINLMPDRGLAFLPTPEEAAQFGDVRAGDTISIDVIAKIVKELRLGSGSPPMLMPPIDVAALYYGIRLGEVPLEDELRQLAGAAEYSLETLNKSASLVAKLMLHSGSHITTTKQLIVTTAIDMLAERALAQAGVAFTRVVQKWSEPETVVTYFKVPPEGIVAASVSKWLRDQVSVNPPKLPSTEVLETALAAPILYKFRGSLDVPATCAISARQLFSLARNVLLLRAVPDAISAILQDTPMLLLGTSVLDPDFRTCIETLLSEPLKTAHHKYLIGPPPAKEDTDCYLSMEIPLWRQISRMSQQLGITRLEWETDAFLDRLLERE